MAKQSKAQRDVAQRDVTQYIAQQDEKAYGHFVKDRISYADARAKETGQSYLVSNMPRVLWDCPDNRRILRELGESIIHVAR